MAVNLFWDSVFAEGPGKTQRSGFVGERRNCGMGEFYQETERSRTMSHSCRDCGALVQWEKLILSATEENEETGGRTENGL